MFIYVLCLFIARNLSLFVAQTCLIFMCCVVIVMHELLVSCITLAQGMSTSPSCFLRRRRPRCVVVVVAVVAFLCRRGLLRCVAVALVVVVVWVDLSRLIVYWCRCDFCVASPLSLRPPLDIVLSSTRRRHRCVVVVERSWSDRCCGRGGVAVEQHF